ncbi:MAG: FkbM family methyltransferase [Chlamydiia bacterium]|nr:FkbM family methyltransferase [Chlamydiia bacterium]
MKILHCIVTLLLFLPMMPGEGSPYPEKSTGEYKKHKNRRLDLIATFLPENPVFFEAGGHYGHDTVKMSAHWPKGRLIAFEPNPHAFQMFEKNTIGCQNVEGYNLAVNNYNGTATLYVCYGTEGNNPEYEGASSLLEPSEMMEIHYRGPRIEVPCVILDDWCKANAVDHIDFMWLDLEGLELQVLTSSPHILGTVQVIYTETNFMEFRKGMTQYKELETFLESQGFKMVAHWYLEGLQGDAIFIRE